MAARIHIRLRSAPANAGDPQPYRLSDAEQQETIREILAKPAEQARSLVLDELDAVKAMHLVDDPRPALMQSLLDQGDALKDRTAEADRRLRRKHYADAFGMGLSILQDTPQDAGSDDLFYQGPSPMRWLLAINRRLLTSMLRSLPRLGDASWRELERLVPSADRLWAVGLVLGGWFVATVVGGWIGLAVNAVLLGLGLMDLWQRLTASWASFKQWFWLSWSAKESKDLDAAGAQFADGLAVGGIALIEVVVTHYGFKLLERRVLARFPMPKGMRREFEDAAKRERARRTPDKPREEPARVRESDEAPNKRKPSEEPSERASTTAVKVIGAKRAADELPSRLPIGWLIALGVGYFALQGKSDGGGGKP